MGLFGVDKKMDAIHGVAAIRLLSEICCVGVMSSTVVDEGIILHVYIENGCIDD